MRVFILPKIMCFEQSKREKCLKNVLENFVFCKAFSYCVFVFFMIKSIDIIII